MAEVVGGGRDANLPRVALDHAPDRLWREAPALPAVPGAATAAVVVAQEHRRQRVGARLEVRANGGLRRGIEKHHALLLTLAGDQGAVGPAILDVEAIQAGYLVAAHAGAEQRQDERLV